jgi:hypothetical protein
VWVGEISATCASAHVPLHGERGGGGADRAGPRHRERRKGRSGQRLDDWRSGPTRQRERRGVREKKTGTDRSAPLGSDREREGARERALPLTGGVRLSGGVCARPDWAELGRLGCFPFFFFSEFSNSFSISIL